MSEQRKAPRRGEVYTCRLPAVGSIETVTVVVVSRDDWNTQPPDDRVWAVPIKRQPRPLAVKLDDTDPVGGWVQIHAHAMIPRDWLADAVGILTGATLQRIREAFTTLQEDVDPGIGG